MVTKMDKKTVDIRIKEACFVYGEAKKAGTVIKDFDPDDASHMVGNGRAEYYVEEKTEEKTDDKNK